MECSPPGPHGAIQCGLINSLDIFESLCLAVEIPERKDVEMTWEEIQKALAEPFPAKDIEWRMGQCGKKGAGGDHWAKALAYLTNRAIMDRLDSVFGIQNWQNEYKEGPQGGVMCGLSFRLGDRDEWITKWDGAENTQIEAVKGGMSDAMKRTAVQLGIGRYLYNLEEGWCTTSTQKRNGWRYQAKDRKNGKWDAFYWDVPELPAWALPSGEKPAPKAKKPAGKKYEPKDPTPAESIITDINNCTDIEELTKLYKAHEQTIMDSPKKDEIVSNFSIQKGFLEERGRK